MYLDPPNQLYEHPNGEIPGVMTADVVGVIFINDSGTTSRAFFSVVQIYSVRRLEI